MVALALHREDFYSVSARDDRFCVFQPENVVGGGNQFFVELLAHGFNRFELRFCERNAVFEAFFKRALKLFALVVHSGCKGDIVFRFSAFHAEAKPVRTVERGNYSERALGEALRVCGGKNGGQFYNRVRAGDYRVASAGVFVENGGFPPLGKVPAHHHYYFVRFQHVFHIINVLNVPEMKRVVFRDRGADFHLYLLYPPRVFADEPCLYRKFA